MLPFWFLELKVLETFSLHSFEDVDLYFTFTSLYGKGHWVKIPSRRVLQPSQSKMPSARCWNGSCSSKLENSLNEEFPAFLFGFFLYCNMAYTYAQLKPLPERRSAQQRQCSRELCPQNPMLWRFVKDIFITEHISLKLAAVQGGGNADYPIPWNCRP